MDTDHLSKEVYNLICIAADFDDTLKSIMGASCSDYDEEDKYLNGLLELYGKIKDNTQEYFENWGLESCYNIEDYHKKLDFLKAETLKVLKISKEKQTFEDW